MPPTVADDDDAAPSAPPMDDVPIVTAMPLQASSPAGPYSTPAVAANANPLSASAPPPRPPPNVAVPTGMMAKTIVSRNECSCYFMEYIAGVSLTIMQLIFYDYHVFCMPR